MVGLIHRRITTASQFIMEHLKQQIAQKEDSQPDEVLHKRLVRATMAAIKGYEGLLVVQMGCMREFDYAISNTHEQIAGLKTGLRTLLSEGAPLSEPGVPDLDDLAKEADDHMERVNEIRAVTGWH